MTRADLLAAARIHGWHGDLDGWRELILLAAPSNSKGVSTVEIMRAYVEGARHRAAGGACGCPRCLEVPPPLSITTETP